MVNYKFDTPVKTFEMESSRNAQRLNRGLPAIKYTIALWSDGSLSCNCPGWTQRNARSCSHVIAIRMAYQPQVGDSQPQHQPEPAGGFSGQPKRRFR